MGDGEFTQEEQKEISLAEPAECEGDEIGIERAVLDYFGLKAIPPRLSLVEERALLDTRQQRTHSEDIQEEDVTYLYGSLGIILNNLLRENTKAPIPHPISEQIDTCVDTIWTIARNWNPQKRSHPSSLLIASVRNKLSTLRSHIPAEYLAEIEDEPRTEGLYEPLTRSVANRLLMEYTAGRLDRTGKHHARELIVRLAFGLGGRGRTTKEMLGDAHARSTPIPGSRYTRGIVIPKTVQRYFEERKYSEDDVTLILYGITYWILTRILQQEDSVPDERDSYLLQSLQTVPAQLNKLLKAHICEKSRTSTHNTPILASQVESVLLGLGILQIREPHLLSAKKHGSICLSEGGIYLMVNSCLFIREFDLLQTHIAMILGVSRSSISTNLNPIEHNSIIGKLSRRTYEFWRLIPPNSEYHLSWLIDLWTKQEEKRRGEERREKMKKESHKKER